MNRVQVEAGQRPCLPCILATHQRAPLSDDTHRGHVLPLMPASVGRVWTVIEPVADLPAGTSVRLYDSVMNADATDVPIEIEHAWWLMMVLGPTNPGPFFVHEETRPLGTDPAAPPAFLGAVDLDDPDHRASASGWSPRTPRELATACVESAAAEGFELELRPDTPLVPDEAFPFDTYAPTLTGRGGWADVDSFVTRWADAGCRWVNLRFGIEPDGSAIVRYEAKPDGWPNEDGAPPQMNGGFDPPAHRVLQRVGSVDG